MGIEMKRLEMNSVEIFESRWGPQNENFVLKMVKTSPKIISR